MRIRILDVRDYSEYKIKHLQGAINIPVNDLPERFWELEKYKNDKILVHCAGGCFRSKQATEYLIEYGFTDVEDSNTMEKVIQRILEETHIINQYVEELIEEERELI